MATTEQISALLKKINLPQRITEKNEPLPAIEEHRRILAGAVIDGDIREQVTQVNLLHTAYCKPSKVWSGGGPLEHPGTAAEQDFKILREAVARERTQNGKTGR